MVAGGFNHTHSLWTNQEVTACYIGRGFDLLTLFTLCCWKHISALGPFAWCSHGCATGNAACLFVCYLKASFVLRWALQRVLSFAVSPCYKPDPSCNGTGLSVAAGRLDKSFSSLNILMNECLSNRPFYCRLCVAVLSALSVYWCEAP